MYTCYLLKKYNVFFYNDTGAVDPAYTSPPLHIDIEDNTIHTHTHTIPSPSHPHPSSHTSPTHTHTLVDQLAIHTGHGLLYGKVRKPSAGIYTHSYTHQEDDTYMKKGK
ncbi:hypothetical protein EON63_04580 [archaeon]|nr:MAG: hypothetical protein EON63_04580 [archaeon]